MRSIGTRRERCKDTAGMLHARFPEFARDAEKSDRDRLD
jgi:hypothetical protein